MPVKPGSMGRPIPVTRSSSSTRKDAAGADRRHRRDLVRRPDPVMFLRYWNNEQATQEKFNGDWLCTGDLGRQDDDGYFWYVGRKDDVISSGALSHRPRRIEACLVGHHAVAMAAAVGSPDPIRGEVVKAFVQLREGPGSDAGAGARAPGVRAFALERA